MTVYLIARLFYCDTEIVSVWADEAAAEGEMVELYLNDPDLSDSAYPRYVVMPFEVNQ